jgi:hypothetical protein
LHHETTFAILPMARLMSQPANNFAKMKNDPEQEFSQ